MGRIAGIIYPDVFHAGKTVQQMLRVYEAFSQNESSDVQTHGTVQLGQMGHGIHYNEERTLALILDGQIWNKKELAIRLKCEKGSSVDLLIKSYEIFGDDFLKEIDGDFAFCLYDLKKQRVILGRDRIGKKPLYWYQDALHFIFASELKSLLVTGMVPQTPSLDGIAAYFALGYFPQDLTPIERVNKLLPGYYLVLEKNRSVHIRPYWSLSSYFSKENKDSKEEISSKLKDLIDKAVQKRIPETGPLGCYVSGGLGSASVAFYVQQSRGDFKVEGYTSGFSGQNEEDVRAAKEFCRCLEIPQKVDWVTPNNFLDDLVPILWQMDEPIADPNIIATWHLAKMGSAARALYSGMGSDEMLAGHNRYTMLERYVPPFSHFLNDLKKRVIRGVVPFLRLFQGEEAFRFLRHTHVNHYLEQYVVQNQLFSFDHFHSLSPQLSRMFDPDLFLQKFHTISRIPTIVSACAYLDMKTRLPDQYILQYDRLTAAFAVDWRTPYLDKELMEYAASIPEPETLGESETATYLKTLFRSHFPEDLVDRPKRTRRNFISGWVNVSDLQELLPLLKNGTLVNTGLISKSWVNKMCAREETMESSFRFLFSVFVLELWFRIYINRPLTATPPKLSVKDLLLEP